VKQLLTSGISVNATVEFFGRYEKADNLCDCDCKMTRLHLSTPLHYAVSEARLSVVKYLIEKGIFHDRTSKPHSMTQYFRR
jgi:hypothetical protein